MKITYDAETDSLYIGLSETPGVDAGEIAEGVVLDIDAEGRVAGIDLQHASEWIDVSEVVVEGFGP